MSCVSLTSTVLDTIGDDLVRNLRAATSLTRAISNAVREVLVVAEATGIGAVAAEGGSEAQHVANTDGLCIVLVIVASWVG